MTSPLRIAIAAAAALTFAGCASDVPEEKVATTRQALVQSFGAGSFIIPMDTTQQDDGMFRAYGLAYALLRANVPIHWAVLPGKAQGGNDFTVSAPATVINRETNAPVATPIAYRGGPFVVSAANRAAALPVINAWLAADAVTVVHEVTAGSFSADIAKTLVAAPSIAIFEDSYQAIAYSHLNAAGIRDAAGNAWSDTSPGALSDALLVGTAGNNADGALFSGGFPAFAFLASEHYNNPDQEVVAEVRSWLDAGPFTHAYMQCAAATAFENMAPNGTNPGGRFLTTNGLSNNGSAPNPLTTRLPADPLAQFDGALAGDTGTTDTMSLAASSAFRAGVRTLINESDEPVTEEILLLTGNLDGSTQNGRVTYLAGHDYSTTTPVSGNALRNGSRLFYNAIFDSPAALATSQPNIQLTKTAPARTNTSTIAFTINYTNNGAAPAFDVRITDPIPAGTTFASAANGGTQAAGIVTWNLGVLGPGATGSVSFTVNVAADATISNQATAAFRAWQTNRTATSNTTSTVRDATAPETTIVSGPPATTNSTTASFTFSSNDPSATFQCSVDGAAFTTCTTPLSLTNVAPGPHTLAVRARDAAGNVDATPATRTWTVAVDGTAPETTIVSGPPATTTSSTASFDFSSNESGATFECSVDGATFAACTDPVSFMNLAPGPHTLAVRARDTAGNVDPTPATHTWTVTTSTPVVDTDGDGLPDDVEKSIGTDPNDADSDDDGVRDGDEPDFDKDTDGDGLINALDPDSDNDGLFDGTELGLGCGLPATNLAKKHCIPDGDNGATKTDPLKKDTDNGGVSDGSEDANLNGVVDPGELDPTVGHGDDDQTVLDNDNDGLSNAVEQTLGSDPNDADSDDDGVRDGDEANLSDDTDGDGLSNVLDPDSDNDGLFDGTESGKTCDAPGTDASKGKCIADADRGATKTSPLDPDTDHGGVKDGDEDTNKNGVVDPGERDPLVAADDNTGCKVDADCGNATSGLVCNAGTCAPGCRGAGGNGCASGQQCSSTTDAVGICEPGPIVAGPSITPPLNNVLEGGGWSCSVDAAPASVRSNGTAVAAALALVVSRLRRRARREQTER